MTPKALRANTNERTSTEAKLRQTCDACQAVKTRCSRGKPSCARCLAQNIPCHYSLSRRMGRPRRLAPQLTPDSPLHARRTDEPIPMAPQPTASTCVNQPESSSGTVDWSGVELDDDRVITDDREAVSNTSNNVVGRETSQNDCSITPRVKRFLAASPSSARLSTWELHDQECLDLFNSFLETADFSGISTSSIASSLTEDIQAPQNYARAQRRLDNSDIDRQSSSLHNFGQHIEPSEHGVDVSGQYSWFSNRAMLPERESVCRCFESALSITLSIEQGHIFPYPGAISLALDVEAQLREAVPLAVQCNTCKARRGEILKLFSNTMSDVVDLLQRLCNAEFSNSSDLPELQQPWSSSMFDGFEWLQEKPRERLLSSSHQLIPHERNILRPMSHIHGYYSHSIGHPRRRSESVKRTSTGTEHIEQQPSPPRTVSSNHLLQMNSDSELRDWRILVDQHSIVGDDRKFLLMHLLRRRLCGLSNVLEGLIRAMQDLRVTLRREDASVSYDDDTVNRSVEKDTRKSLKTASKLYDIIDQLEKVQI
ncbi:hypothetical protein F5884DRAFT_686688 [Xylogone sp. PMI_703]|nr:hypothetical protein F5884DRAFT_686688 [Xylogone sp. PMI_703]